MRHFGLLLHISSLPSPFGIGDIGPVAHNFVELLQSIGAKSWQLLPVNPTEPHLGNSPYASPSAFAGNPLFISPELLLADGYITQEELDESISNIPDKDHWAQGDSINYPVVATQRETLLSNAFARLQHTLPHHQAFQRFCADNAHWLDDYARFVSIKRDHNGASWVQWSPPFKRRDAKVLASYDQVAKASLDKEKFIQFLFHSQWQSLRTKCQTLGISLIGDVPIYVTHDSADVWAHSDLFYLDTDGNPTVVAGVPPDYFSATGQRWGSPLYRWDRLQQSGYLWWKQRFERILQQVDVIRLDHFRGFCGYWEIPAQEKTAINGQWRSAPGQDFLHNMQAYFSGLPFIAENLGIITDDVRTAMYDFGLPGMHVLQFAFGGENLRTNPDVPFAQQPNSVVYTGTHDNPPSKAWYPLMTEQERLNLGAYVGQTITQDNIADLLIHLAFGSVATTAIIPVQDVLHLDAPARMNTPGSTYGNWQWRLTPEQMKKEKYQYLTSLADIFAR